MSGLPCVSVSCPVVNMSAWEIVHLVADGAVILAVLVGVIELWAHRGERRELTAAIDDLIRVVAIQAWLQVQAERPGRAFGPLLTRLMTRGTMPGDLMATWLTTIAAEAPRASSQVRRDAGEVARVFFALAIATKRDLMRHGMPDPITPGLGTELDRLERRLAQLGGVPA